MNDLQLPQHFVIIDSVVDLRREPRPAVRSEGKDPLQETQLIYNEEIIVLKQQDDWFFIEAIEQKRRLPTGEWGGYPGWIPVNQAIPLQRSHSVDLVVYSPWADIRMEPKHESPIKMTVTLGTQLEISEDKGEWWIVNLPGGGRGAFLKENGRLIQEVSSTSESLKRQQILYLGGKLLGSPYLWGGRSAYCPDKPVMTSVDCSGFVNLLYRTQGIDLPRDAHDQYLVCNPRPYHELKPGDFVFLADSDKPQRMSHVMLFTGEDGLLEATLSQKKVRMTTGQEKLGVPLKEIGQGSRAGGYYVYFGDILIEDP